MNYAILTKTEIFLGGERSDAPPAPARGERSDAAQ